MEKILIDENPKRVCHGINVDLKMKKGRDGDNIKE
jgi:hypothetical protein